MVNSKTIRGRNLRLCLFGDEYSIHARRWVTSLRDIGHHVDFITLRKGLKNDIGGISLDATGKLSYLFRIGRLRALVRDLDPDIFHTHMASSYGFVASFVRHPRKILSVWGDDVVVFPHKNLAFKMMSRRSLTHAGWITCTSGFLKDTVSKLGHAQKPLYIIPFGIDLDSFPISRRDQGGPVRIGMAKGFIDKYGVDILIKAVHCLVANGHNIRLALAGRGYQLPEYVDLAKSLGIEDKVEFLGFLKHEQIPDFLGAIDIFAMPSITDGESFGVAALEASATGLPVVATRVGGVPEVVIDGVTGILVARRNAQQLADALKTLIENPELRRQMGMAGREHVEKHYRWESNVKAMNSLYAEVMG
jgi:glycosyltransferase involved in cell wall biosynthesis